MAPTAALDQPTEGTPHDQLALYMPCMRHHRLSCLRPTLVVLGLRGQLSSVLLRTQRHATTTTTTQKLHKPHSRLDCGPPTPNTCESGKVCLPEQAGAWTLLLQQVCHHLLGSHRDVHTAVHLLASNTAERQLPAIGVWHMTATTITTDSAGTAGTTPQKHVPTAQAGLPQGCSACIAQNCTARASACRFGHCARAHAKL